MVVLWVVVLVLIVLLGIIGGMGFLGNDYPKKKFFWFGRGRWWL